jgi:hypothetical protein
MRKLDTATLDEFARACVANLSQDSKYSKTHPGVAIVGKDWVLQSLYNLHFKDEFEHVVGKIKSFLNDSEKKKFEEDTADLFTPRSDEVFKEELAKRLAIDTDGKHIPGLIGNVIVGSRKVGRRVKETETARSKRLRLEALEKGEEIPEKETIVFVKDANWQVYAGEDEERAMDSKVVDPLPDPSTIFIGDEHTKPVKKES